LTYGALTRAGICTESWLLIVQHGKDAALEDVAVVRSARSSSSRTTPIGILEWVTALLHAVVAEKPVDFNYLRRNERRFVIGLIMKTPTDTCIIMNWNWLQNGD
jgi:hypothetical protein